MAELTQELPDMMQDFHAGYISDAIRPFLGEADGAVSWREVIRSRCFFSVDHEIEAPRENQLPELAVLENLISRGLPTIPSLKIEQWLADTTGLTVVEETGSREKKTAEFKVRLCHPLDEAGRDKLRNILCLSAPEVECSAGPGFDIPAFGSHSEERFWRGPLADLLGTGALQWVERQRAVESIGERKHFENQQVDFSLELPGCDGISLPKGIVFEYDGVFHETESAQYLDRRRDHAVERVGWCYTLRYNDADVSAPIDRTYEGIVQLLNNPVFQRIQRAVRMWPKLESLNDPWVTLVIAPLAIARIQRVMVRLIRAGVMDLGMDMWKILVVERDVPCARIAFDDLQDWMTKIWTLYAPERTMPAIDLQTITGGETRRDIPDYAQAFDLVLDVSVLQRYGTRDSLENPSLRNIRAGRYIYIRSGYRESSPRILVGADPIIPQIDGEQEKSALEFFLRELFRKQSFRDGQLPIIRRLLRGQSVVALLPTGSGKSLTYQLPALLQNGLVIAIDPIKSLMKDQHDGLLRNAIDSSVFVYSNRDPRVPQTAADRKQRLDAFKQRRCKFAFVSPERMMIPEFRDVLKEMGRAFCFAVVDEAHCVSEWGHDFRTSYLMLGRNLRNHCGNIRKDIPIPIAALTGTASFEVLEDVQRELGLHAGINQDHTVRPEKKEGMTRDELEFRVIKISHKDNGDQDGTAANNWWDLQKQDGSAKQMALVEALSSIAGLYGVSDWPSMIIPKSGVGSGLIFCPHRDWVYGVKSVRAQLATEKNNDGTLRETRPHVGLFMGADDDSEFGTAAAEDVQRRFMAGDATLLACTKAFGMGIDKSNIRFTIHLNIPSSPESFYQEAGRAGRDREQAQCWILYSGATLSDDEDEVSVDRHIVESFHDNSFRGVDHDLCMIYDLLERIRMPTQRNSELLAKHLSAVYGGAIRVRCGKDNLGATPLVLLDRDLGEEIGTILYHGTDAAFQEGENQDAHQILTLAKDWIAQKRPSHLGVKKWLWQLTGASVDHPGIEKRLDELRKSGKARSSFVIPFTNGYFRELQGVFDQGGNYGWLESYIEEAFEFCYNPTEFKKRLVEVKQKKTGKPAGITAKAETFIDQHYSEMRRSLDTMRAIQRLVTLGLISDVTVDYNSDTFTITLENLDDSEIRKYLSEYYAQYAAEGSPEHTRWMRSADHQKADTPLRRYIKGLVNFVYDKIAAKRRANIATMEEYAREGTDRPELFKERVNAFFEARYAEPLRNFRDKYSVSDVIHFIAEHVENDQQDIKQLLGSCDRVLIENPENGMWHALRAFSLACIGEFDEQTTIAAIESALADRILFRTKDREPQHEFLLALRSKVSAYRPDATNAIDACIVQSHRQWLRAYNNRIKKEHKV